MALSKDYRFESERLRFRGIEAHDKDYVIEVVRADWVVVREFYVSRVSIRVLPYNVASVCVAVGGALRL